MMGEMLLQMVGACQGLLSVLSWVMLELRFKWQKRAESRETRLRSAGRSPGDQKICVQRAHDRSGASGLCSLDISRGFPGGRHKKFGNTFMVSSRPNTLELWLLHHLGCSSGRNCKRGSSRGDLGWLQTPPKLVDRDWLPLRSKPIKCP